MKIIKDRKDRGIFVICLNFKKEPLIIIPDYWLNFPAFYDCCRKDLE